MPIHSCVQSNNPIAIELTRGGIAECTYRASVAIVDTTGKVVRHYGDIESPIYPRSAVKLLQATPMVESTAHEHYKLSPQEIAITCASHSGESEHAHTAQCILHKIGLDEPDLECGCQDTSYKPYYKEMIARNEPFTQLHNNCSGKHSGMLTLNQYRGWNNKGYIQQDHPVQQAILGTMEMMYGIDMSHAPVDVDGCSAPTWAVPLKNVAYAFAQIADPSVLPTEKEHAVRCLRDSVMEHPYYIGGTNRFDTVLMETLKGKIFAKSGADGVYTVALPDYGLGIAVKVDCGTALARTVITTNILEQIGVLDTLSPQDKMKLEKYRQPIMKNRRDIQFGTMNFVL